MPTANHSHAIKLTEIIGLQTPRGRLLFFLVFPPLFLLLSVMWPATWPPMSLYALLGIPSPSIGLTRAFLQLIQGNLVAAWQQNWLIFPAVATAFYIICRDIVKVAQQRRD